jgi:hypothetical protein
MGSDDASIPTEGSVNSRRLGVSYKPIGVLRRGQFRQFERRAVNQSNSSSNSKSRQISENDIKDMLSKRPKISIVSQTKPAYARRKAYRDSSIGGVTYVREKKNEDLRVVKSNNVSRERRSEEQRGFSNERIRNIDIASQISMYMTSNFNTIKHPKSKYSPLRPNEMRFPARKVHPPPNYKQYRFPSRKCKNLVIKFSEHQELPAIHGAFEKSRKPFQKRAKAAEFQ